MLTGEPQRVVEIELEVEFARAERLVEAALVAAESVPKPDSLGGHGRESVGHIRTQASEEMKASSGQLAGWARGVAGQPE